MIYLLNDPSPAAPLFDGWPESILWSCLQGVMGTVYGDDAAAPRAAAAVLGDFRFLAGEPSPELVNLALRGQGAPLLIPRDSRWDNVILRQSGDRAVPITRYATRKDTVFDRVHLEKLAAGLENSYTIRKIDRDLYDLCKVEPWSRDLVSQFPDWNAFRELGLGFAVIQNEKPISGAASYARYREGIEIEIDTHPGFRRRGLALACGARLILECLDLGLYPSWDAHTPASLALAEQLGYRPDRPYAAFAVNNT